MLHHSVQNLCLKIKRPKGFARNVGRKTPSKFIKITKERPRLE